MALALLLTAACSGAGGPAAPGSSGPATGPVSPFVASPSPTTPSAGPAADGRMKATLGGVPLVLEVADTPALRAVGLMRRTSVPPGTGMVFVYPGPVSERYYMFGVPIPLRAVFIRAGQVVSTVVMPPCGLADPAACATYGADAPYDTVVETTPDTLAAVRPGDAFTLTS